MNEQVFSAQITRLADAFGKTAFSSERVKIIWAKVRDYDAGWFTRTIDGMIAGSRHAPLPADFDDAISRERERVWKIQKGLGRQDAHDFMTSKYMPEDKRVICQTIVNRLLGQMPDDHWRGFLKLLGEK